MGKDSASEKYLKMEEVLLSEYQNLIKQENYNYSTVDDKDFKIFFSWWQGKENMPYLVQRCYENLVKRTCHEVCFVDKNNFDDYVEIPSYIIDEVNKGTLLQSNFSDVLRFSLLNKYGGMWTDATVFYTDYLENHPEIFNSSLWTMKSYNQKINGATKGMWLGGMQSTNLVGNPFYNIGTSIFYSWLKKNNTFPIYFFAECIMLTLYHNNKFCKIEFDKIMDYHHFSAFFRIHMNEDYCKEEYEKSIKSGFLHLLSWKKAIDYNKDSNIKRFLMQYDKPAHDYIFEKRGIQEIACMADYQYRIMQETILKQLPKYRLMTHWLSILCNDGGEGLFHSSSDEENIICTYYDNKIALYIPGVNKYISNILKDGRILLSEEMCFFDTVKCSETDMQVAISIGNSFLSAGKGGKIEIVDHTKGWEKFNLIY